MKKEEQLQNTINNISILNDLLSEKLCLLDAKTMDIPKNDEITKLFNAVILLSEKIDDEIQTVKEAMTDDN
ncbi:hypothetical protein K7E17_06750 [Ligilactobacillus salivarius]|uniref:hypothetical protein n=1 Tax=Ligilactobacillus salivarius TaxID=1624 RepID=UPI001CBC5A4B|nr:hypothetical protein [Ligilactobacillus salivarius]MBZ4025495.1 hypothetical protein [Ligilactobacillus salivarius]